MLWLYDKMILKLCAKASSDEFFYDAAIVQEFNQLPLPLREPLHEVRARMPRRRPTAVR